MENRTCTVLFFLSVFVVLFAARLCHTGILWADEDYHQAAAIQVLHGKTLYRDIWYDKPPLNVAFYLLFGATGGWVLRLVSAIFATGVCLLTFDFARSLWSRREGFWAAGLMAFSLIFYFPDATLTLEPDTLMIAPHLSAVYLAWQKRPWAAGIVAGIATLLNVKGIVVLAVCALFLLGSLPALVLGFLIPNLLAFVWLVWTGALGAYWTEVWKWGLLYAGSPPAALSGLGRLGGWLGFHATLVIGAVWYWWRDRSDPRRFERVLIGAWTLLSLFSAGIGLRFSPRYMDQLLPPLTIAAGRGLALLWKSENLSIAVARTLIVVTLAISLIRFGPRYFLLAYDEISGSPYHWADIAMDQDSRRAAAIVRRIAQPGDTIFIWGYRPNLIDYTRMPIASRFWDSQPLTGVPADRHLFDAHVIAPEWAAENRRELVRSSPSIVADGLSFYNPRLDIHNYPEFAAWMSHYCEAGRTATTIIYRKCG